MIDIRFDTATPGHAMARSTTLRFIARLTRASNLWLFVTLCAFPLTPAQAYLGPGSGLAGFGSLLALLGVIGFALLGFVWYPFKRLWRRLRGGERRANAPTAEHATAAKTSQTNPSE